MNQITYETEIKDNMTQEEVAQQVDRIIQLAHKMYPKFIKQKRERQMREFVKALRLRFPDEFRTKPFTDSDIVKVLEDPAYDLVDLLPDELLLEWHIQAAKTK
jgi:type III secretory pathway component EscR